MLKLILFDLDGVLVDAKDIHYQALNQALGEFWAITPEEHRNVYDGRKTVEKLEMLTERKGLPVELHEAISVEKQLLTVKMLHDLPENRSAQNLFKTLESEGYMIGVCSNSIRRTVLTALSKSGLIEYCSVILSNEDVKNSKPHPEIYWKAMSMMGVLPEETMIVEDSPPGLLAAERSRAQYIRVANPSEVNIQNIIPRIKEMNHTMNNKWKDEKLNVLIPMAGAGTRFSQAGYTFPKPLIDVNGKPMIQVVVENLGLDANFIFVVQKEHREKFHLENMLPLIAPNCKIVEVDGITEGAACTALLAKEYIDNDAPLFFANSDQWVDWNPMQFMYDMQETDADGGIVTFKATHPKWSFARVNSYGIVTEVAEKNPISDDATVGYYYWKRGSDFIKYAEQMIEKDVRVNNEFYVCPVFNEAIEAGMEIRTHTAKAMWGLGTPEDLEYFLKEK
jgi:HAD superfamily hydrolase (TIGR01509 family)